MVISAEPIKTKISFRHYRIPTMIISHDFYNRLPQKGKPPLGMLYRVIRGMVLSMFPHGIEERGGKTICEIRLGNGDIVTGMALCSMSDRFCYKTGRELARWRAIDNLIGYLSQKEVDNGNS